MLIHVCVKRLSFLSLAVLLLALTARTASARDGALSAMLKRARRAVVVINTYDPFGNALLRGNGFFIDAEYLITGAHVLAGANSIKVTTFDGKTYSVTGVPTMNERRDLAMLRVSTPSSPVETLPVEDSIPREGEEVIVISNPRGDWKISKGSALGVWDFNNLGEMIRITACIMPGSSGGPVINRQGRVVGVVLMQVKSAEDLNFAVPGERIKELQRAGSFAAPGRLNDAQTSR